MKKTAFISIALLLACGFVLSVHGLVRTEGDRVVIIDRWGEHWDVMQARSIGFKPERFQYGIGRNAFETLDDTHLGNPQKDVSKRLRVIGVREGNQAQAYSVPRLVHHEIANTTLGSKPIAVGY